MTASCSEDTGRAALSANEVQRGHTHDMFKNKKKRTPNAPNRGHVHNGTVT